MFLILFLAFKELLLFVLLRSSTSAILMADFDYLFGCPRPVVYGLNVGTNRIYSGKAPEWISKHLPKLRILQRPTDELKVINLHFINNYDR